MGSYHFIGIKGSGMSALAQVLYDLNHIVQGEDVDSFLFTQVNLDTRNIPLYAFGMAPLSPTMTVIASNAFEDTHPSIVTCQQLGIPVIRYHDFLGELLKTYTSIAVTGSHGKTTTTGMLVHALSADHPTCSLVGDGTGTGHPDAAQFIFESCEYKRHFLSYQPDIAIITNIDFDHPDYFADIDDVRNAFEQMTVLTTKHIVACGDDPQVRLLPTNTNTLFYGFGSDNTVRASDLTVENNATFFNGFFNDTELGRFSIPLSGKHSVLNALATIGVALLLDRDLEIVRKQLATFSGVQRRFTEKRWGNNVVIDDYAHHPSEIRATFEAARSKYPGKRVVGIFQPHTFTRLEKLMDDFADSLKEADDIFLCPIFGSAREASGNISIDDLRNRIPNAQLVSDNFASDLNKYSDSILIFMGAGDIQKYQELLLQR
ncbi:UDP-N-acetylmuramate--L-alanine ligase [Paenibacillus qinlingensis]|uniref:UDP-N-acetylmuramate--L-alanine ligase n=1 Tax=Paenibacillus qinlingensis TaxID=1837343 RepID=A0ABU1NT74_9BACL|nr:UDP-N-acetylmuramate--L-alanine ligase [Paenibacillus qinlingensis]MDR6550187.1 UDP-N-acetylmuramate--alanine ligase [Paenibacillus qinlingensis]